MTRGLFLTLALTAILRPQVADAFDCSTLPNPIYVSGVRPAFLATLSTELANSNITLLSESTNACSGILAVLPPGAGGAPITGTLNYWDTTGTQQSCSADLGGTTADIAIAGLYPATCATILGLALPDNLADTPGPSVPYVLVTPSGVGAPSAISAEEAYYLFGYGLAGGIVPWTDPNQTQFNFLLSSGATQEVISGAIGVVPSSMLGQTVTGSSAMVNSLTGSADPLASIGMLSSDVYDVNRGQLNALAFRGYGQDFAWAADADGGFDKRNVREGRYVMSAELHFLALTIAGGQAASAGAQTFLEIANGTTELPVDLVQLVIKSHLVPACAMKYERIDDTYDPTEHYGLAPSPRTQSCDCYFDSLSSTSSCADCTSTACSTGVCRRNLCETF